mmetsp:Transcript_25504/g.49445  ORF Transcript_25504/g.49445 Transcript_25504/m.49445 type:complete len:122 (-) Transcript_25504:45-410(-)
MIPLEGVDDAGGPSRSLVGDLIMAYLSPMVSKRLSGVMGSTYPDEYALFPTEFACFAAMDDVFTTISFSPFPDSFREEPIDLNLAVGMLDGDFLQYFSIYTFLHVSIWRTLMSQGFPPHEE